MVYLLHIPLHYIGIHYIHTYTTLTYCYLSSKAGFKFNIKKTKIMAIQYHHFMANRRGESGSSDRFYFLAPKITGDSDWSYEIKKKKKSLLLWRKAMTNLDSIFKGTDISLLTKVHIAMLWFFSLVTYRCESWTIKKAGHQRINAFKLWCWRRLLRVP